MGFRLSILVCEALMPPSEGQGFGVSNVSPSLASQQLQPSQDLSVMPSKTLEKTSYDILCPSTGSQNGGIGWCSPLSWEYPGP